MHSSTTPAATHSDELRIDTDWRKYVSAPTGPDAIPVRALSVTGNVAGLEDFLARSGALTLTFRAGDVPPVVVLDYGTNVAGRPWFDILDTDTAALLHVSYSESAHWAGPAGDERGGHNASANANRSESIPVDGAGRIGSARIQGGQRYQRLALETPGTVSITAAGILNSAVRASADQYQGWFVCSSDDLNRIWYESANTVQLNQLPANSLPVAWCIDEHGLRIDGGTVGVLRDAAAWTDVSVSFHTRIVANAAGWVVRAEGAGARGYLLELRTQEDPAAALLRWSYFDDGFEGRPQDTVRRYTTIGETPLPDGFDPGAWHAVRTTVEASTISVTIDNDDVVTIDLAQLPQIPLMKQGSVGFHEAWYTSKVPGEEARFRDLVVTAADGTELFRDPLNTAAVLDRFIGDGLISPDPLPVILDGGRRDRSVWSGDLIVQVPNVFYTTAAADYVAGSIELLNSFQEEDGRLPARLPPLFPPATYPQHGQVYSAVYSMHQITNVALHHLYTGDTDFVQTQWPALLRQLHYDRTLVDERGLYITGEEDGLDWDWYDGAKTGAVSAYNIVYHLVLRQASVLAAAIGDDVAAELTIEAERSRAAINEHLFDAERHLYVLSDTRRDAFAQDANALAIIHGVAPDGEATHILSALDEILPQTPFGPHPFSADAGFQENVSPYASGFHLNALFEAGHTNQAITLLRDLWGHMAAPGPYASGTVWELLNTDGTPGFGIRTSLAHGWACAPTVALSSYVLGVTAQSAAFHTWRIAPQPGSLAWARGQVPTPAGAIEVSWDGAGPGFHLDVTIPITTAGTIVVSVPSHGTARLQGTTTEGDIVDVTRVAGADTTSVSFDVTAAGHYVVDVA